jgi:hypothetical protein
MQMPEKDPLSYSLLTYAWVIALSITGGFVSFFRKIKEGRARAFNVTEFIGEIVTSGFAGILTFYLSESAGFDPLVTASLVGISGHMGSKFLYLLEQWAEKKLPMGD